MMKRYEATMTYAEYTGEPEATMNQDEHGEYVKAEVAKALYDALQTFVRNSSCQTEFPNACEIAEDALSLADGETE